MTTPAFHSNALIKTLRRLADFVAKAKYQPTPGILLNSALMSNGITVDFFKHRFYMDDRIDPTEYGYQLEAQLTTVIQGLGLSTLMIHRRAYLIIRDGELDGGFYLSTGQGGTMFVVRFMAGDDVVSALQSYLEANHPTTVRPHVQRLVPGNYRDITFKHELLTPLRPLEDIQAFYPWLGTDMATFWAEFSASDSNVLLLLGEPGMGKTTFIRHLIEVRGHHDQDNVYLVDRQDVIGRGDLPDKIREFDHDALLVIEDANTLVRKREQDNDSMLSLLNVTDGLISNNTKIVITANLTNLQSIDTALLRPGRCFRIIRFNMLTKDEANRARASVGLESRDFTDISGKLSLAEALRYDEYNDLQRPARIGF